MIELPGSGGGTLKRSYSLSHGSLAEAAREASGCQLIVLVPGATVRLPVSKGELLTQANLMPDRSKFVYQLRQLQDEQLAMER